MRQNNRKYLYTERQQFQTLCVIVLLTATTLLLSARDVHVHPPHLSPVSAPHPFPDQLTNPTVDAHTLHPEESLSSPHSKPRPLFLHLTDATEGLTAWLDVLREAGELAASLGRILVEPCVLDGGLVICEHGHVAGGDGFPDDDTLFSALVDGACSLRPRGGRLRSHLDPPDTRFDRPFVLPVSSYLDWDAMSAAYPMMRYHEWAREWVAPEGTPRSVAEAAGQLWLDEEGRVVTPTTAVMGIRAGIGYECVPPGSPFVYGPLVFLGGCTCPSDRDVNLAEAVVGRVGDANVFIVKRLRSDARIAARWAPGAPLVTLPRFAAVHYAAVREWMAQQLPPGPYSVTLWRSYYAPVEEVGWCAGAIANATGGGGRVARPCGGLPLPRQPVRQLGL